MTTRVFVSGCFDMLHSGHIEFLQRAAAQGDELYVALGSDRTVFELKGAPPINHEQERCFMVQSVGCVYKAFVSTGSGYLDFEPELQRVRPDIFVVNEDGNTPDKRLLCEKLGIQYRVLARIPNGELPSRSTTSLRRIDQMPYRIDLAGGWLDQPFVSKHYPGSVITLSIAPTVAFNERSGMANSTRRTAIELWGPKLPVGDPTKLAKILFCCDNPPGTTEVSGAQDTIGLVFPGLTRSDYAGEYWPHNIEHVLDEDILHFVESHLYLIPLGPRTADYAVLHDTHIDRTGARALAEATELCWKAILHKDIRGFGESVRASFEAQIAMFPHMVTPSIQKMIENYRHVSIGWKISGAGGGGYLILVSRQPVEHALRPYSRRDID